jgi:hypothetical protein
MFSERCLLPDKTYYVTGTWVENPNPEEEHDCNLIVKGRHESTFVISWTNEKTQVRVLRNTGIGFMWLSAGCVGWTIIMFLRRAHWI